MPDLAQSFGVSTDDAQPADTSQGTSWSDYPKAALSGAYGLQGAVQSLIAYGNRNNPEASSVWNDEVANAAKSGGDVIKSMSPAAQQELNASVFSGSFWDHQAAGPILKLAQMTPPLLAATIPGGVIADMFGAGAGVAASVASNAALNTGQYLSDVHQSIRDAPDYMLEDNPAYQGMISTGMSKTDARDMLADNAVSGNNRLALVALVGGLAGAGGVGGLVAKGAGSGFLKGAVEGGGFGALQGGVTDAAQQSALTDAGVQSGFDKNEWLSNFAEQLGIGGALGGGIGALHGGHQAPGEATVGRSARTYPKPDTDQTEGTVTKGTNVKPGQEVNPPDTTQPAPVSPIDPAIALALAPKGQKLVPNDLSDVTSKSSAPPAAPTPATDTAVPEAKNTLALQQADMVAGKRPLTLFKGGDNLLPLPGGMKQTKIGGDVFSHKQNEHFFE